MSIKKNIFDESEGTAFNSVPIVTYTGHMRKEKEWESPSHSHDCAEILYCVGGKGAVWIEDKEYPLQKGDIAIFNPYVANSSSNKNEEGFEFFFLGINDFCYPPFPCNTLMPEDSPVFSAGPYEKQLQFYFQELLSETSQSESVYMPVVSALANVIVLQVLRIHQLNSMVEKKESDALNYSRSIKEYIDKNYNKNINLDTLSEASFISKSYISHQFKKHMGQSPIDYLIKKRMEIARNLLVNTNYSVAEVAQKIGYDNPLYFSALFKKQVGLSPSVYRKSYTQGENNGVPCFVKKEKEED